MNIDAFNSGSGIEDLVRAEIHSLFPQRYGFHALTVTDRSGRTAGGVDIAITNDHWFPEVKSGATKQSRHVQFPIEGVYAILEVKQTLSPSTLDEAMEKLVKCSRLKRPIIGETRVTENRTEKLHAKHPLTMLYTGIVATSLDECVQLDNIVERFVRINQTLQRQHVVRALCVLGHATVMWGIRGGGANLSVPAGPESFDETWYPARFVAKDGRGVLHPFIVDLYSHCNACVLPAEDIPAFYADQDIAVQIAFSPELSHKPNDRTWHSYHERGKDGDVIFLDD